MANIKIAQLTNKTTLADTDIFIVESATQTQKMTVSALKNALGIQNGGIEESGPGYIKFKDGTMIQLGTVINTSVPVTTAWGSWFISGSLSIAFPIEFYNDDPSTAVNIGSPAGDIAMWMGATISKSGITGRLARGQSATISTKLSWQAIGRWKA